MIIFLIQIDGTAKKNEDQEDCENINSLGERIKRSKMYQKNDR